MRRIYKGEKRLVGIEVYGEGDFTLENGRYVVVDDAYAPIGDSGTAEIGGGHVHCLLDTSQTCYEAGKTYYVYFHCSVSDLDKRLIGRCQVHVEPAAEFEDGS